METDQTVTADAVAAIFVAANWQPSTKDGWKGSFTWSDGVVVGGIDPWGTMRATSNAGFGMTLEEAAAWLVEHARQRAPVVLTTEATLAPPSEPEQDSAHENDSETGAEAEGAEAGDILDHASADAVSGHAGQAGDVGAGRELEVGHTGLGDDESSNGDDSLPGEGWDVDGVGDIRDADFTEDPLLEFGGEVLEEHPEEHGSGAFIFGDNLDQKRTAAIGLVMQAALARMPAWSDTDTARLSELRNFAMGVSEGRWNDDPGSRQWLEELETRLRRRSQIVSHRDGLVEFLNTALHPDLDAFDPNQGWPE